MKVAIVHVRETLYGVGVNDATPTALDVARMKIIAEADLVIALDAFGNGSVIKSRGFDPAMAEVAVVDTQEIDRG